MPLQVPIEIEDPITGMVQEPALRKDVEKPFLSLYKYHRSRSLQKLLSLTLLEMEMEMVPLLVFHIPLAKSLLTKPPPFQDSQIIKLSDHLIASPNTVVTAYTIVFPPSSKKPATTMDG
jgi:hypothetical protein